MKKMMILGAVIGFTAGILSGVLSEGSSWPSVLLRSSIAALVFGLLLRWWGTLVVRSLYQAHIQRAKAAAAAAAAAKPATSSSSP